MTIHTTLATAVDRAFCVVEAADRPELYRSITPDHPPHYPHEL